MAEIVRGGLLALGLALYPATQLRYGGLPVGPGEMLIFGWLGLLVLRLLARPVVSWNPALSAFAAFWIVLVLAESLGMVAGLALEPFHDFGSIAHDISAFILLICVSMGLAIDLADQARRRLVTRLVVLFGAAVLALQIADGFGLPGPPGVTPWFFDRLRGWANDANMLGLAAATFTLLSLHLIETAGRVRETVVWLACAAIAFAAGLLTRSDSYVVCVTLGVSAYLLVKGRIWLQTLQAGASLRGAAVVVVLLAAPLAAISALPFLPATLAMVEERMETVYEADGQGDTRFGLWSEAIEKGLDSGLLGFGPGAHLTAKSFKRPPPDKFESHNMLLELLTQGGVIAAAAYFWLCALIILRTWRARLPALTGLALGFVGFGMFHLIVRHPLLWFVFTICLLEAWRAVPVRTNRPAPAGWPASGLPTMGRMT